MTLGENEWEKREHFLLEANRHLWTAPFRGLTNAEEFRRGFVETVNIEARVFLMRSEELFGLAPVRHIRLLDVAGLLGEMVGSPYLARLSELSIGKQHLGEVLARQLAESPHVSGLIGVAARAQSAGRQWRGGTRPFRRPGKFAAPRFERKRHRRPGARAIAASPQMSRLEWLELAINDIGFGGLEALAASNQLQALRVLGLSQNRVGAQRGRPFDAEPSPPRLRVLDLSENGINPASIGSIIASPYLCGLELLDLNRNHLGNAGVETLAGSELAPTLRSLFLNSNQIGDEGRGAWRGSPLLEQLSVLDLSYNPIHDAGALELLNAGTLRRLRRLGVPTLGLSMHMRRALRARFGPTLK